MRLLLKCTSPGLYEIDVATYAIVNITDELLKTVAKRRRMFLAAKAEDRELNEMYFWDESPDWYPLSAMKKGTVDDETLGDILEGSETDDILEISEDFEVAGSDDPEEEIPSHMEMNQMAIDERQIYWLASPSDCDAYCSTKPLTYDLLFKDKL
jgi:hypothetical protein